MKILLVIILAFSLTGCKTVEQVLKAAHDLIDIAGKTIEDVSDNVDAAKKVLNPEPDKK